MVRSLRLVLEMYSSQEDVCALKDIKSVYKKEEEEEEEGVKDRRKRRKKQRRRKDTFMKTHSICHCWKENFCPIH